LRAGQVAMAANITADEDRAAIFKT